MSPKKKNWIDRLFWPLDHLFFPGLLLLGALFVAAVLFPIFARGREMGCPRTSCPSNLSQITVALAQYAQDYDEKFPSVANSGANYGWVDTLYPYTKSTFIYQCPNLKNRQFDVPVSPNQNGYTDYYLNANIAGKVLRWNSDPAQTILVGEGNDSVDITDARYAKSAFPSNWLDKADSPLYRHKEMANYAFADGHVKALKPTQVQIQLGQGQFVF